MQEHAPAAQALNYNREAVLRAIEFRTPPFYVLDPDDWPRTTWDACAAALIMMDIFYIPFVIAFLGSSHWCACCPCPPSFHQSGKWTLAALGG